MRLDLNTDVADSESIVAGAQLRTRCIAWSHQRGFPHVADGAAILPTEAPHRARLLGLLARAIEHVNHFYFICERHLRTEPAMKHPPLFDMVDPERNPAVQVAQFVAAMLLRKHEGCLVLWRV